MKKNHWIFWEFVLLDFFYFILECLQYTDITSTFLFSHGHIVKSITNKIFVEDDGLGQIVSLD